MPLHHSSPQPIKLYDQPANARPLVVLGSTASRAGRVYQLSKTTRSVFLRAAFIPTIGRNHSIDANVLMGERHARSAVSTRSHQTAGSHRAEASRGGPRGEWAVEGAALPPRGTGACGAGAGAQRQVGSV
jgi:hypothetical protein